MRIATPNNGPDSHFEHTGTRRPAAAPRFSLPFAKSVAAGVFLLGLAACQPGDSSSMTDASTDESATDAQSPAAGSDTTGLLATDNAKASYTMGYGVTRQVSGPFGDVIDQAAFIAGVRAQLDGETSMVSEEDAKRALTAMQDAQQAKQALLASSSAKDGAKFLADNAGKEGVVTTASGLQYLVLTQGEGAKPTADQTVKTHYEGTLINGEIFDSSVARGEPATFPLNRVIAGWTEALQLMNVGSKYRLFIPPELAYGNQATGSIPAQSTLIFEVELLEIVTADNS